MQTVVPFAADNSLPSESAVNVVRQQLRSLEPTWQAGNLGLALTTLAAELDAARMAGMQTALALRPGNAPTVAGHRHRELRSFGELGPFTS